MKKPLTFTDSNVPRKSLDVKSAEKSNFISLSSSSDNGVDRCDCTEGYSNTPPEIQDTPLVNFAPIGNGLYAHIDYLKCSLSLRGSDINSIIDYVNLLGLPITQKEVYFKENTYLVYDQAWTVDSNSLRIYLGKSINPETGEVVSDKLLIEMTGDYLSCIKPSTMVAFLSCLHTKYKVKWHRIDLAIDDVTKQLSIKDVKNAWENNAIKGVRSGKYYLSGNNKTKYETMSLGSRKSMFHARFYETRATHKDIDTIRFEAELKRDYAHQFIELMLSKDAVFKGDVDNYQLKYKRIFSALALSVCEYLRFIDLSSDTNRSRCKISSFWSNFQLRIDFESVEFKFKKIYPVPSLQRSCEAIDKQYAKRLYMIKKAMGVVNFQSWLMNVQANGCNRMKSADERIIETYRMVAAHT